MNKELVTISTAVFGGAIARGATGMLLDTAENTTKMGVNLAGCAGFGFLSTKVTGNDSKAAALRGLSLGASIAHGLLFISNIASTEAVSTKLATTSKINTFLSKAAGLNNPAEGLAGYIDAEGNYHEDGLAGYIDANGNFIDEDHNTEYVYEDYQDETEGLQASIDADGNIVI